MVSILNSKLGFFIHCLAAFVFILGGGVIAVHADPLTSAIAISIYLSVGSSVASFVIPKIFAPKQKPLDKNKIGALDVQASYVGLGSPLLEIYGGKQADNNGGFKTGVNFTYLSDIRHVVTTTTQSSGSGGGKGGSKKQTTNEHHYFQDILGMVGFGEMEILQITAGTKVIYKNNPKPLASTGTHYQAESGTLGGGASNYANVVFASGHAVLMPTGGTITKSVTGDGSPHAFYFQYKSDIDTSIDIAINGMTQTVPLPETFGRVESIMVIGTTNSGATTVYLHAPTQTAPLYIDEIIIAEIIVNTVENIRLGSISGVKNNGWVNPSETYDYQNLINPVAEDWRTTEEYNYQVNANTNGERVFDLPAGCSLRIYEGSATQLPDPIIEAFYAAQGLGAPAYRHRTYFMLDNFEVTEYGGSTPQITVIAQHKTIRTLGAMYQARALRTGLSAEEIDFSAFASIPLRGFGIQNIQSPKTEMAPLNDIFDIEMIENEDGVIIGIVPDETVTATLYLNDLDAQETVQPEQKPVDETLLLDYEIERDLTITAYDPLKDFEIGSGFATRQVTVSQKQGKIDTGLVLLTDEVQKMTDRIHQKKWVEKNPASFNTFPRHGFLKPMDLVKVQNLDETFTRMRIYSRNGAFPGVQKFSGKARNILEPYPRIFDYVSVLPHDPLLVDLPGHTVGTLIDVAILRSADNTPGIYAACARTDSLYRWKGATLMWERETGYESLSVLNFEATIGRVVSSYDLGAPLLGWEPGEWDDDNIVLFDLFGGEVESLTDAEVLDGKNILLVGDEIIAFATAARVSGYPNRWNCSRLRRELKGTVSLGHGATERVVLLNDAVKWIPLDVSEFDQTHNYKFVSSGQDVESASKFEFTWSGKSKYNTAAYQTTDSGVPVLQNDQDDIPVYTDADSKKHWIIRIREPLKNGYSLRNAQLKMIRDTPKATVGFYGAGSTDFVELVSGGTDVFNPDGGLAHVDLTGETFQYTAIDGNFLTGITRGVNDGLDLTFFDTVVYPIDYLEFQGLKYETRMPQNTKDYHVHYRWRNDYRFETDGWSVWAQAGYAHGSDNVTPPPTYMPPPPPDTGFEDPGDPVWVSRMDSVY